jgi:hypothetical protein
MRLRRGPREVYRVYGEHDAPAVDEWSGEAPTREFAVPSDEARPTRRPHARLGQLRRVAVMTLLGVGVGLVAALALHSLRGSAGIDGRRAGGWAGPGRSRSSGQRAASWPSTSPPEPVAVVPARARTSRTVQASPIHVATVGAPRAHSTKHEPPTRRAAPAVYAASYPAVHSAAATPSQGTSEAQSPAAAAQSEFTFER